MNLKVKKAILMYNTKRFVRIKNDEWDCEKCGNINNNKTTPINLDITEDNATASIGFKSVKYNNIAFNIILITLNIIEINNDVFIYSLLLKKL